MTTGLSRPAARIALAVSDFNPEVTAGLREAACAYLAEQGCAVATDDVFAAPGAFELPLMAQALARTGRYDGVVCLGCVIKGDTAHFEFISLAASLGLMNASLATETPIAFGVLTTYSDEQAEVRSTPGPANKGREAAEACWKTVQALRRIREA
jgi:6,7-dimethyl-8-ribityllumazine synthase